MKDNLINSEQLYNPQLPNQQINPQPIEQQYIPPPLKVQPVVLQPSQKYILVQPVSIQYIPQQVPQSNPPLISQPVSQPVPEPQVQPPIQQNAAQPNVQQYITQPVVLLQNPQYIARKGQHRAAIPTNQVPTNDSKVNLGAPIVWTWFYFILELIVVFIDIPHTSSRTKIGQIKSVVVFFSIAYLVTKSSGSKDVEKYNTALLIFILYVIFYSGIFIYVYFIVKDFNSCTSYTKDTEILIFEIEKGLDLITICILCCYKQEFNKLQKTSNQQPVIPQRV